MSEILTCVSNGDFSSAMKLTDDDLVDKLSLSGSPDQIVEKIEKNFVPYGFRRIMMIHDSTTYAKTGITCRTPSFSETVRLVRDKTIPQFAE